MLWFVHCCYFLKLSVFPFHTASSCVFGLVLHTHIQPAYCLLLCTYVKFICIFLHALLFVSLLHLMCAITSTHARTSTLAITDGKRQLPLILPSKRKSSTTNFCHWSFIYNSLWTFLYFVEWDLFFQTKVYYFKKTFLSWLFYLKYKFAIHFRLNTLQWSEQYCRF